MSAIATFLEWLYSLVRRGVLFVATVPGLIVAAVSSGVAAVSTMFSHFTWLDNSTSWIDSATRYAQTLVSTDFGVHGQIILGFVALDKLLMVMSTVLAVTIGVVLAVFITIFLAVFALVPACLTVKMLLKAVRVASVGFIKP